MEHVLYADILFFINFSMDFITLYLTSRLTSGPPSGIRCVLAAIVGGIYGTAAVALGIDGITGVIATGVVSVIMVLISLGFGHMTLLLKRSAIFWGCAALLGGIMTAICSVGDISTAESPAGGTALLFAGSTLCLIIVRIFSRFNRRRSVKVRILVGKRSAVFNALCDSGNLVSDPLSGKPVIIADRSVLRNAVPSLCTVPPDISGEMAVKIRMIPVRGIDKSDMLTGFIPDSVFVSYGGKEKRCDAVIAVTDSGNTFFGGFPANVPSVLI